MKKTNLPAMPFYIGDWKKDPGIQVLTREQKMIWFEMLMLMWESAERGYLTINSKPIPDEMLAVALNLDNQNLTKTLTLFDELGLYSRRESDGAIYSRKQIEIIELSEKRKNAGIQGGNPNLVKVRLTKKQAKGLSNAVNENEIINTNVINNELVLKEEHILQKFIKKNCPNISKLKKQLTFQESEKLFSEFTHPELQSVIEAMENYKPLSSKSISVNLTIRNWIKRDKQNGTDRKSSTRGSIDFNKWEREIRIARGEMPDVVPGAIQ